MGKKELTDGEQGGENLVVVAVVKIMIEPRFHLLFVYENFRSRLFYFSGVLFFWLLNQILCDLPTTNKLNKWLNSNQCQLLLRPTTPATGVPLNLNSCAVLWFLVVICLFMMLLVIEIRNASERFFVIYRPINLTTTTSKLKSTMSAFTTFTSVTTLPAIMAI